MRHEERNRYRKKLQLQRYVLRIQMAVIAVLLLLIVVVISPEQESGSTEVTVVDEKRPGGEKGNEISRGNSPETPASGSGLTEGEYPSAEELGIDLFHPVKYEGRELEKRLKELAELSDAYRKLLQNRSALSDDLLSAACNNPEILPFALSLLEDSKLKAPSLQPILLTEEEKTAEGIPLLLQFDERWGACGYGESMIAVSGCAPTCLSMVIIGLTGDTHATPDVVASYADEKGYYLNGIGTDWSFLTEGARHFGLSAKEVTLDEDIVLRELEQGHPIICSMRKGTFTAQGHFIVLAGVKDGQILVRDPNSRAKSEMLWDFSEIKSQIRNLWRYVV
ncbi:MAG: C39 family peptidase [Acetatifactor sp.]